MTSRVLVTGASGFVGRACMRRLRAIGIEALGVSRTPAEDAAPMGHWRPLDLSDGPAVKELLDSWRPTHVLHCAWPNDTGSVSYDATDHVAWLATSFALAQRFHEAGGERLVGLGTCAEYDWNDGRCIGNQTALQPESLYGSCKHALNLTLSAYARSTGLSFAWARPFFIYGPGEDSRRLVASVTRGLLRGERVPCTHGRQRRDYLYVEDLAEGLVALLCSKVASDIDFATGNAVTVKDVILEIARQLGATERVALGAKPSPPRDVDLVVGDCERAREALAWSPKCGLSFGIAECIAWHVRDLERAPAST